MFLKQQALHKKMILLNQNSINNVAVTLQEKSQLWINSGITPFYLFEFINDDTAYSLWFTGTDISPNPVRFNQFNIIETGMTYVNLTASTINLSVPGFYKYTVYEQVSATNLQLSGTTGNIVEQGKVYFSGNTSLFAAPNQYTGGTLTYNIYTNQNFKN